MFWICEAIENAEFFVGKCLDISYKLHGGNSMKYYDTFVKRNKNLKPADDLFFTPISV